MMYNFSISPLSTYTTLGLLLTVPGQTLYRQDHDKSSVETQLLHLCCDEVHTPVSFRHYNSRAEMQNAIG